MATFMLVHPAWLGGWCWRKLAPLLRESGHQVHTPTLTGLGERAHLAHPGVDLATHIEDIVNALVFEDLDEVILVGNSSAGVVITGVAERCRAASRGWSISTPSSRRMGSACWTSCRGLHHQPGRGRQRAARPDRDGLRRVRVVSAPQREARTRRPESVAPTAGVGGVTRIGLLTHPRSSRPHRRCAAQRRCRVCG